ncbi:MAG: patatin-like phospholipase family protein [Bacteroidota bacterium]
MEQTIKPFENIGIAFSGGGFRAAAFALGTLSYLNHIGLDEHISFSSSASGGSITNLLYTAYRHEGKSFDEFYQKLLRELAGSALLERALENLNNTALWGAGEEGKQRNLINAFSLAYDELVFEHRTLEVYWPQKSPGYEVCLNTTEFYRGLSFRFQMSGKKDRLQVIGNKYLKFDMQRLETLKKIRLGDVLAASSCFPIGFEPIVYPRDFTHAALSAAELRAAIQFENYKEEVQHLSEPEASLRSFGFMDGGITDNQGLKSVMLADQKRQQRAKPDPFDLIIVTDVASYFMESYEVPVAREKPSWLNNTVNRGVSGVQKLLKQVSIAEYALLLTSLTLILLFVFGDQTWALAAGCSLATLFLVVFAIRQVGFVHAAFRLISRFNPLAALNGIFDTRKILPQSIIQKLLDFLTGAKLSILTQMLEARATSVVSMVSDINLKQVRRLIFEMFYDAACWDNRRVPNFIYELSSYNSTTRTNRINSKSRLGWTATEQDKTLLLEGLETIGPVAEEARTMGTTLWFSEQDRQDEKLKKIIVTGQFTTCVNLLEYIISLERKKVPFDAAGKTTLQNVKDRLMKDLAAFKADPYLLYDGLAARPVIEVV